MRKRLLTEWIELLLLLAMTGCNESAHAQTDCLMSELLQTIKNRDKYLSKKENRQKELRLAFCILYVGMRLLDDGLDTVNDVETCREIFQFCRRFNCGDMDAL